MNQNERYYRKVIGSIGFTMLLFLLLINLFGLADTFAPSLISIFSDSETTAVVSYQIFYGAGYLLCFMLPVVLLKLLIGNSKYPYQPMHTQLRVSPWLLLIVPAGIAIVFSVSYVNAAFVSIFDYSAFSNEVLWGNTGEAPEAYELVLEFMVTCLVPGFCEEFLFRGAIQTNCRPFGRSNAVFISAFLFAMMHQNPEQFLYTFAAGIVLGVVYEMTGSIWSCTVLHILNNFAAMSEGVIFSKIQDIFAASVVATVFEILIFTAGLISLAVLIMHFFSKKQDFHEGIFEKSLPASDGYATCPIEAKRAFRLFLTPSMVIFLVLCVLQMLLLILMAVTYGLWM